MLDARAASGCLVGGLVIDMTVDDSRPNLPGRSHNDPPSYLSQVVKITNRYDYASDIHEHFLNRLLVKAIQF